MESIARTLARWVLAPTEATPADRCAQAAALRAAARDVGPERERWLDAADALESAPDSSALKRAAAAAQRLVAQHVAVTSARGGEADAPFPSTWPPGSRGAEMAMTDEAARRRRLRGRRDAARERERERALAADREGALPPEERPVESLPGCGRAIGDALRKRGLKTLGDLAFTLPRRYEDERRTTPFGALTPGERQVVVGVVASSRMGRARRRFLEVTFEPMPEERGGRVGALRCIWFHAPPGLASRFVRGALFRIAGRVESFRGVASMVHPDVTPLGEGDDVATGVTPRYAEVPGVSQRTLARLCAAAAQRVSRSLVDATPEAVLASLALPRLGEAVASLHAPPANLDDAQLAAWNAGRTPAHARLALEEFVLLELGLHLRREQDAGAVAEPLVPSGPLVAHAAAALPFALTAAQERVLGEICADMGRAVPMRRLLQGDVGSGKTAVAMLAAAHAVAAGAQVAIMAPTEVLAEQHLRTLAPLARSLGLRAALVVGGARAAHRRVVLRGLGEGTVDVAVGTHALLVEGLAFRRLRLVIVDEQHRFGVAQRLRLVGKSASDRGGPVVSPHLLVMTATPIPRTLALTLYGDLDVSVIDEPPPGRIPPVTRAYPLARRDEAYVQVERALAVGGRAFVVCPVIEDEPDGDVRDAVRTHAELKGRFSGIGVELLHGRRSAAEKQAAMDRFVRGEARVLVATTVVEVGVDVPEANVIVVEHAERFGLAQLHQLRGRVGRAGQRSACLLVHDARGEEALARLRVLCETSDGFRIAEEDLRIRGPGELFGHRQAGLPGFRFGDLRRDVDLLAKAREVVREMVAADPALLRPEHAGARRALERLRAAGLGVVAEEAG